MAEDINNLGQVVGYYCLIPGGDNYYRRAFLYNGSTMLNLNDLIDPSSGWKLTSAEGINDAGQIVGFGYLGNGPRAFLLTPVPEPGTWAMLAGLGFFGLVAAFRRWR